MFKNVQTSVDALLVSAGGICNVVISLWFNNCQLLSFETRCTYLESFFALVFALNAKWSNEHTRNKKFSNKKPHNKKKTKHKKLRAEIEKKKT